MKYIQLYKIQRIVVEVFEDAKGFSRLTRGKDFMLSIKIYG